MRLPPDAISLLLMFVAGSVPKMARFADLGTGATSSGDDNPGALFGQFASCCPLFTPPPLQILLLLPRSWSSFLLTASYGQYVRCWCVFETREKGL